ncbi:hypothetical protein CPC08DRAFT_696122 [Agrocybe pediades]|nr:hypothetical protein CPC08DRAFT_696122 [Agrocybe pediades]
MPKSPTKKTASKKTVSKASTRTRKKNDKDPSTTSYQEACAAVSDGVKKFAKSKNTSTVYQRYVKNGQDFVRRFAASQSTAEQDWMDSESRQLSIEGEDEMGNDFDQLKMDPEFPNSLSGRPIKCTPVAIAMFIAQKCMSEACKKSTASGIHAAFLQHYEQMAGDKYRGRWTFDDARKEWVGNPARSAAVEDIMGAVKNKDGESERKHSRAMSIQNMRKLYQQFLRQCPPSPTSTPNSQADKHAWEEHRKVVALRATYLLFNALSSSAFVCWMRIGEVTNLQYKSLHFPKGSQQRREADGDQPHHFILNLRNRKNWQKREKSGEHQLSGHCYRIYPQTDAPEVDMYRHVLDWLDYYEYFLLGRQLEPEDYIFPTVGANGTSVQPSMPITSDMAQKKINQMAASAGIQGAEYLTTHCFRRGGAQHQQNYRFMFAPKGQLWTLARIRWWGGWAIGEHRDTLIRYLLDELYTYEEDHSDALNPNSKTVTTATEGEAATGPENRPQQSYHTVHAPPSSLLNDAPFALASSGTNLPTTSSSLSTLPPQFPPHDWHHIAHQPIFPSHPGTRAHSLNLSAVTVDATPAAQAPLSTAPPAIHNGAASNLNSLNHIIPGLPRRTPTSKAWEVVVRDWENADPSRSLYVALKDWDPQWHSRSGLSQLYGQRAKIAEEFIGECERDEEKFKSQYPEHKEGIVALLKAITAAQQARGVCATRKSRKHGQTGEQIEGSSDGFSV